MRVDTLLDDIEQQLQHGGVRSPGRFVLLDWMSNELADLVSKAPFDWSLQHLDPAVATIAGRKEYALPENFPENFVAAGGLKGDQYVCKLDDGTNENPIDYVAPAQYFSENIRATSNGTPSKYTIMSAASGGKQILLYPPPDANGSVGYYTIDGLYQPTDWILSEREQIPPVPGNSRILEYAVLRRLIPEPYGAQYGEALNILMLRAAQQRRAQAMPVIHGKGSWDPNTMMRS